MFELTKSIEFFLEHTLFGALFYLSENPQNLLNFMSTKIILMIAIKNALHILWNLDQGFLIVNYAHEIERKV